MEITLEEAIKALEIELTLNFWMNDESKAALKIVLDYCNKQTKEERPENLYDMVRIIHVKVIDMHNKMFKFDARERAFPEL